MTIAQEEIFGPVLSIIPYSSEEDGRYHGVFTTSDTKNHENIAIAMAA